MLRRIFIQNLATIEKQSVEFEPGFLALTGETGAGKSIVIKAVTLILGEKCPRDLIRAGTSFLAVEAVFDIQQNDALQRELDSMGIGFEDDLTIRRKVTAAGKNAIFINDFSSSLSGLSRISSFLIDLHGQHSQQTFLRPQNHIDFYDDFLGVGKIVSDFGDIYREYKLKKKEKESLEDSAIERQRKIDFIRFQISEIDGAGISQSEEKELRSEFNLLNHAEQLMSTITPIANWSDQSQSPLQEISSALAALEELLTIDPQLEKLVSEFKSGVIILEEAIGELSRYGDRIEINPQRLDAINERFSELDKLKRKYGGSVQAILIFRSSLQKELDELEMVEVDGAALDQLLITLENRLKEQSRHLSEKRKEKQSQFELLIMRQLKELGMAKAKFAIQMEAVGGSDTEVCSYTPKGADRVEFLISTNPGSPLRPLSKIASGGEISRIMLALKTVINSDFSPNTMIFDEIDAGISGRVAETVGRQLSQLGERGQVVCITHSPQIASAARLHYKVAKIMNQKSSSTQIKLLDETERIAEIAQFLAGNEITEKTLSVAKDMLLERN